MRCHRLRFIYALLLLALPAAGASRPKKMHSLSAPANVGYALSFDPVQFQSLLLPSSPDDWLGGGGDWSDANQWSAGLPGSASDVVIGTGSDHVTLDTDASIQSLSLGVDGGQQESSVLTGDGSNRILAIAGALTIGAAGEVMPNGATINAGSLVNRGVVYLDNASHMTIDGDASSSVAIILSQENIGSGNNVLTVTGTLTIQGIGNSNLQINRPGDVVNAGQFINNGSLFMLPGTTLNLTNQPNGITAIPANSQWLLADATITANGEDGFAHLTTVDGRLNIQYSTPHVVDITPLGGAMTIHPGGVLETQASTGYSIHGDVNDSGAIFLDVNFNGPPAPLTISGTLSVTPGGSLELRSLFNADVGTLINNGLVSVSDGATLNVHNPGGITDIPSTASYLIGSNSSITANGQSAFANLTSIEGKMYFGNSESNTISPNGGVLTVANGGQLRADSTTVQVNGELMNHGTTEIDANLAFGAVLMAQRFTANEGSFLQIGVSGPSLVGALQVSGQVTLAGTLVGILQDGYTPNIGDTFKFLLFTPGELSGTFSSVQGEGENWDVVYDNTDGYVELVAEGGSGSSGSTGSGTGTTPEPASIMLFGSGALAIAGKLRSMRKP